MTTGRPRQARVQARRDGILTVLFAASRPMTHRQITEALGRKVSPSTVYADLRALSHSSGRAYSSMEGAVNDPGYPVIWNSWSYGMAAVTFELTPDARTEMLHAAAQLEAMWMLSDS